MYQLISIGDITIDQYYQSDSLTQEKDRFSLVIGGKYYSDFFHLGLGGSGANVAIQGTSLGLDTAVVGKVGEGTFKNVIVQHLIKRTVSTEFLYFDKDYVSISTILLSKSGEKTVVKHSDSKKHIELSETAIEHIKQCPLIFMGNLPDISVAERASLIKKVKSPENIVAMNFGSKDSEKGVEGLSSLIELADIVILNRYEYGDLIGKDGANVDLEKNQHKALKSSPSLIVISDGAKGAYAYSSTDVYYKEAVSVKNIVDTTGAGDAFTAAFLYKYSQLKQVEESLGFANEHASKVLGKIGAN